MAISTEPEFATDTPQVVFEGTYVNVEGFSYDVAPDGQRFLILCVGYDFAYDQLKYCGFQYCDEMLRSIQYE
jgi:hypothetical protein